MSVAEFLARRALDETGVEVRTGTAVAGLSGRSDVETVDREKETFDAVFLAVPPRARAPAITLPMTWRTFCGKTKGSSIRRFPEPISTHLYGLSNATQIVRHGPLRIKSSGAEVYVATSLNGKAPYFTASLESAIQGGKRCGDRLRS